VRELAEASRRSFVYGSLFQPGNLTPDRLLDRRKLLAGLLQLKLSLSADDIDAILGLLDPDQTQLVDSAEVFDLFVINADMLQLYLKYADSIKREISLDVIDNKDGTYAASFLPGRVGYYSFEVKLDQQHLRGSPFCARLDPSAPPSPIDTPAVPSSIDAPAIRSSIKRVSFTNPSPSPRSSSDHVKLPLRRPSRSSSAGT
jgi:hypothetical protein